MAFRFRCPKCMSTSFSIERDSRSYAPRGQAHELIFSCRCGKQLFGEQIEKEYLRQKASWEADAAQRKEPVAPARREPAVTTPRATAPRREAARPEVRAAPATPKAPSAAKAAPAPATGESSNCGWKECANPPRPNSKYCSRDCSNKNARHRYKKRKNKDQAAA